MCVCVFVFADVAALESAIITSQLFFRVSHRGLQECLKLHVDALQTFTWQKQPGQDQGTPKNCSKGEVCLHMWLSLWPLTQHWAICNPNKGRHPGDFFSSLHNTPLVWNGQLLTLLTKHLATSGVTCFPLRAVYLHRSIFPKAFDLNQSPRNAFQSLSLSWIFTSQNLHLYIFCTSVVPH